MPASLEEIRETMSTSGTAGNLVPKIIDRLLFEGQRKFAPLRRALPRKKWDTNTYYFNQRTALPLAQATTEAPLSTDVAASQSTYAEQSYNIKHIQSQLDLATFAAQVAVANGNLYDLELMGAAKSLAWLEDIFHLYGSAGATVNTKRPQWDGFDLQLATTNKIDGASAAISTALLDGAIDTIRGVAAQELGTDWFFCMSPQMQSAINALFVNQQRFIADSGRTEIFARDDYGFPNATIGDNATDAGFEVQTYRGIPIVCTSFLNSLPQMGTVATATATTGGQLAAATYYYMVEAVTKIGLTYASAEVSQATTGSTSTVTLTWSTPTPKDAYGNTIDLIGYRIHRSTTTTTESLYAVVAAYDASDSAVLTFVDTGAPSSSQTTPLFVTVALSGSNAASDGYTFPRVKPSSGALEDIFLIPRNPEFAVVPVVNEATTQMLAPVNARTRQFALTADLTFALRAPAFAAKIGRVKHS